jgi:hypothetical protein
MANPSKRRVFECHWHMRAICSGLWYSMLYARFSYMNQSVAAVQLLCSEPCDLLLFAMIR